MNTLPSTDFGSGWSGQYAAVDATSTNRTPDGETAVRCTWGNGPAGSMPTLGRSFASQAMEGDIVAFWLRTDVPIERVEVILGDADDVGAEQSVASLLRVPRIEAGRWYYVAWPYRLQPGWVRYARSVMDWARIKSITFQTWQDQLHTRAVVEIGPFHVMSFAELEGLFEKNPERAGLNRSLPWRVLSDERCGRMMSDYHEMRAREAVEQLRRKYPPAKFIRAQEDIRKRLAATYLMPDSAPTSPAEAKLVRTVAVDGVRVEQQLLKLRDGVYSTAEVYLPNDGAPRPAAPPRGAETPGKEREAISSPPGGEETGEGNRPRHPAIFMLPGHGDPEWSPSVQNRCLSFAKRGYVVLVVEPFGQNERGDIAGWNESHDAQSTAYLLPTGQGLLGCIMSDHRAELSYLLSRPEVDARRVAVTGVSMGGTHSVWFAAIEPRVSASVPDAVLAAYSPRDSAHHMGLCDLMIGAYKAADMEMMWALISPRPLMELIPAVQAPLTDEGWQKLSNGLISYEEAEKKYACDEAQLAELHRYSREVYRLRKVPDFYLNRILPGPHDYTKEMREDAAGFLTWAWGGGGVKGGKTGGMEGSVSSQSARLPWAPIPEPPLHPIVNRVEAVATLNFWPDGKRPPEVLGPTSYVQRETARLIARLPAPPVDVRHWRRMQRSLQSSLKELLGVPLLSPHASVRAVGRARAERDVIHKFVVSPEPGIEVPMLLFEPDEGVPPNGRLVVLLDPSGMTATACCEERAGLTHDGAWVLCVDLRGMGETRYAGESGGYLGFHDYDIACHALKLGETLAGYWTKDLLAAIAAAKVECGKLSAAGGLDDHAQANRVTRQRQSPGSLQVIVRAKREAGLVALLAASQSDAIDAVETTGMLASYNSPHGYGLPFAYSDENNNKGVRDRTLGGYGSMLPCIPRILQHADVAQLAALVVPRTLTIAEPRWASNEALTKDELDRTFAWTKAVYHLYKTDSALKTSAAP